MTIRPFAASIALCLIVSLVAPPVFFIAPQTAHAIDVQETGPNLYTNIKTTTESTISAVKNTITSIASVTSAAANVAMQINQYVLQPLAFILSGQLMKAITAGVIAFVIGKANGTGIPQFVVDVRKSMQTVSDSQELAFLNNIHKTQSPFSYSIAAALNTDYLTKSSLEGFWAANICTLEATSPNVPAYLAGNWSQGGVAAWLALTTQIQNNPYSLFLNSQGKLASVIGPGISGATGARIAELGWGNGFMSWCGSVGNSYKPGVGGSGVNPGDPCINEDGTSGTIKTPGTVIVATLNKVLGGQQDQIVRMGNVGPQINSILGNIATVVQTVNFAEQLLGGSNSGGLLSVDTPSGSNSISQLDILASTTTGTLGITYADVYRDAASSEFSGSSMLQRVSDYSAAWNTIGAAAATASTSLKELVSSCLSTGGITQVIDAQNALTNEVIPVLAQADTASTTSAFAAVFARKVQDELNSSSNTTESIAADLRTLQVMSPTSSDVAQAQQDAQEFGAATSTPAGSLNVSGSTLVDQMNLISTNAAAIKASSCTQ